MHFFIWLVILFVIVWVLYAHVNKFTAPNTEESNVTEKTNDPDYEQHAVAFLDILGFSALIAQIESDQSKYDQLIYALRKIRQYQDFAGSTSTSQSKLEVSVFSDSISISAKLEDILSILWSCGYLFGDLLYHGVALRGGVAIGKLHHEDGIIFGEGLVNAYKLESSAAIYPRIVFSKEAVAALPAGAAKFIKEDFDGLSYLDCFEFRPPPPMATELEADGYDPRTVYLKEIRKHIASSVSSAKNLNHFAKWQWLANKYNSALDAEKDSRIEAIEKINA